MAYNPAVKLIDTANLPRGVLMEDGTLCTRDYLFAISEGDITNHSLWTKIGYTPTLTTSESDVWSYAGNIFFATAAAQWEVVGTANDDTDVIKGNAEGVLQVIQGDADGDKTHLEDDSVNFNAATAVEVGDCVLLDPKGMASTPEWGYVTTVANNTLTVAGGFSSGGTAASRYYSVVDKNFSTGAQVVKIDYLTNTFVEKTILVCLDGTTPVEINGSDGNDLTDTYRVNAFRVVAAGSLAKTAGAVSLRIATYAMAGDAVYSNISLGFTRARNSAYTVPVNKVLHICQVLFSWGHSSNQTHYGRMYTRVNREPTTGFLTGSIFYPYSESVVSNSGVVIPVIDPVLLSAGTDIKTSGIATAAGAATSVLRGWLETV